MNPDDDRWLRETLDDAVRDVEPRRGLDDIAASVRSRPRRFAPWAATGAGLLVAATIGGIALAGGLWSDEPQASPAGPATTNAPAPSPSAEDGTDSGERIDGPLAVYYVGDTPTGPRLFREFEGPDVELGDGLAIAVQMAVTREPDDPDYRTPWPEGTEATASYDEGADLLTIDLSGGGTDLRSRPVDIGADEASMALQQLVHTAQAAVQDRAPVQFLLDGEAADTVLGVPTSSAVTESDPMQVQAPVWVISPQEGVATNTLRVEGRGAFFEANVSWQVFRGGPDGALVKEGFATAEECCTLSPYSFEVPGLEPGDYFLRVYDADMSGGEGPGEQEDTKSFTITG